jgi:transcriptional regulator with XRE-family HTH domain
VYVLQLGYENSGEITLDKKHEIVNHIGLRIKEIRDRKKLKQTDLAAKLQTAGFDIDSNTISKIERGLRNLSGRELCIFAKVLGVSPFWLADVDES